MSTWQAIANPWTKLASDGITTSATRGEVLRGERRRVLRGVYLDDCHELTATVRARTAIAAAGPAAVGVATTAAVLHGLPVVFPPPLPEVAVQGRTGAPPRHGILVRACPLRAADVTIAAGVAVTTPARTLVDLLRSGDRLTSIVACEAAAATGLVPLDMLDAALASAAGSRHIRRAQQRRILVEPRSQSPLETAIRLRLRDGGLPVPVLQHEVRTEDGHLIGVLDLAYEEARLGIEGDGHDPHCAPDALYRDRRRANLLGTYGWHCLRFTWADAMVSPAMIPQLVRDTLAARLPPRS